MIGQVGERLAHIGLGRQPLALEADKGFELGDQGFGALLADGAASVGGGTTDLLLNRVETGDALQDLIADGRAGVRNGLDHFAPAVAPAIGEPQRRAALAVSPLQPIVAGKAVDLQHAVKTCEHLFRSMPPRPGA